MKKGLVVLILLLAFTLFANTAEHFVIRIDNPDKNDVTYFYNNNYDIASYLPGKYLDLVVDNNEFNKILSKGYKAYITQTEDRLKRNISEKPLNGYRSYDEMLSELQQIVQEHPDICKLYDIGDSWGKIYSQQGFSEYDDFQHDIWLLKISDNVETEEDEPNIFYTGEHHAREPISMEMVMKIINHIVDNYGTDTQITNSVNNKQIWFIPLINPNGHKLVWDQTNVWWRKNIRDNNSNHHIYSGNNTDQYDGVDPNRNYGFQWGNVGASDDWTSETYHGPNPFSEPNTQAVRDFILSHKFVAGISYHSYSELVLFPLGYENGTTAPDHDALEDLAVSMANSIPKLNGGGHYTPEESWQLYPCMGTSDDYFYGACGIFAYTIELGTEFIPPSYTMNNILDDNLQAAMILLNRVDSKVLTGHITDSQTGQPISAKVYVEGIDNTGVEIEPYMSDENFGRYYRLLLPGEYSVTFSKYGYTPQTLQVHITNTSQTILEVALAPISETYSLSGIVRSTNDFSTVSNAKVYFRDLPIEPVFTNENGEFTFEFLYPQQFEIVIEKEGFINFSTTFELTEDTNMPFFLNLISGEDFENGIPDAWQSHIITNQWHIDATEAYSGTKSLRSNNISDMQNAVFSYQTDNLADDARVSFYHKVSSEANYDFLKFYIDDNIMDSWSGDLDWSYSSYTVPAGSHLLKWVYSKDQAVSNGDDCAWIDMVSMPETEQNVDFVVYPSQINISVSENTSYDSTFVLFNNSNTQSSITLINSDNSWLTIENSYANGFDLNPFNGVFINFHISPLEEGNYNAIITIEKSNSDSYQIPVSVNVASTIENDDIITLSTKLNGAYPNPFLSSTKSKIKFSYQISDRSKTELTIYNLKGQLIKNLVNKIQNAGKYYINWDLTDNQGKKLSSGIYLYSLKTDKKVFTKKLVIIK